MVSYVRLSVMCFLRRTGGLLRLKASPPSWRKSMPFSIPIPGIERPPQFTSCSWYYMSQVAKAQVHGLCHRWYLGISGPGHRSLLCPLVGVNDGKEGAGGNGYELRGYRLVMLAWPIVATTCLGPYRRLQRGHKPPAVRGVLVSRFLCFALSFCMYDLPLGNDRD